MRCNNTDKYTSRIERHASYNTETDDVNISKLYL